MSVVETFHGYIETTQDSLLIFEACRRCLLPTISRRLQERERQLVRSGSVFVFDEKESGIKRWTDGLVWSPSRILGNFLIYRELHQKRSKHKRKESVGGGQGGRIARSAGSQSKPRDRHLIGSLSDSYDYKTDGLIKKTMSLTVNGVALHLVSYYHPDDVVAHQLRTPSSVPELANLEISPELLIRQNFRIPPMIEPDAPSSNAATSSGATPASVPTNTNITTTLVSSAPMIATAVGHDSRPGPPRSTSLPNHEIPPYRPSSVQYPPYPSVSSVFPHRWSLDMDRPTYADLPSPTTSPLPSGVRSYAANHHILSHPSSQRGAPADGPPVPIVERPPSSNLNTYRSDDKTNPPYALAPHSAPTPTKLEYSTLDGGMMSWM